MMKEPWFWRERSFVARAVAASLEPGSLLYDAARRWRVSRTQAEIPPVPVLCVGNVTLGGVGKTPFALLLQRLLKERGIVAHFLTRGYGGRSRGPLRVGAAHEPRAIGDEALLLAAAAPTWVSRNRAAGAAAATAAGAEVIIMDDGYQNPSLGKTLSFLLTEAEDPFGNGRLFPAGPLREPPASALARADAVVSILSSRDQRGCASGDGRPAFRAWLEPAASVAGKRVVAFCGIARPQRFFTTLERSGAEVAKAVAFADHHPYTDRDVASLRKAAQGLGADLMTTEKDFVRLPREQREDIQILPVQMAVDDPDGVAALMLAAISSFHGRAA